jgi:hypothetical protein
MHIGSEKDTIVTAGTAAGSTSAACSASSPNTASKKDLCTCWPRQNPQPARTVDTQRTKATCRVEPCDPVSIEHGVRRMLASKGYSSMMGIWLLIPELLRLGVWDLLCGWARQPGGRLEPRLGLQLANEPALCLTRVRQNGSPSQKGLELACGLPFLAADAAVHDLLATRAVAEPQHLQVALGRIRLASGHYRGEVAKQLQHLPAGRAWLGLDFGVCCAGQRGCRVVVAGPA